MRRFLVVLLGFLALFTALPASAVEIAMYGDSTMYGATYAPDGTESQCPGNEPASVGWLFDQAYPLGTVTVSNHGIGGTTLAELLAGTAGYALPWSTAVNQVSAKIIVLNMGLNDTYQPGITPAIFAQELANFVTIARAKGKIVVLQTSTPMFNDLYHNQIQWELVNAELWEAQHMGVPVINLYGYARSLATPWLSYLSDGHEHPNINGYYLEANYAFPILQGVVAGLLGH